MNIRRIRRLARDEQAKTCDWCEQPCEKGYALHHDDAPSTIHVCDACLKKTRDDAIGFWSSAINRPEGEPQW